MQPQIDSPNIYQQWVQQYEADVTKDSQFVLSQKQKFSVEARAHGVAMAIFAPIVVIATAGALSAGLYMTWSLLTLAVVVGVGLVGLVATACLIYRFVLYCDRIMNPPQSQVPALKSALIRNILQEGSCAMSPEKWKALAAHCEEIHFSSFLYAIAQRLELPLKQMLAILKKIYPHFQAEIEGLEKEFESSLERLTPLTTFLMSCDVIAIYSLCDVDTIRSYINTALQKDVSRSPVTYRDVATMIKQLPKLQTLATSSDLFPKKLTPIGNEPVWSYLICCSIFQQVAEQSGRKLTFTSPLPQFHIIPQVIDGMAVV
jgi:hypothetical protein